MITEITLILMALAIIKLVLIVKALNIKLGELEDRYNCHTHDQEDDQ